MAQCSCLRLSMQSEGEKNHVTANGMFAFGRSLATTQSWHWLTYDFLTAEGGSGKVCQRAMLGRKFLGDGMPGRLD